MQHKRKSGLAGNRAMAKLVAVLLGVGVVGFLLTASVPAPQRLVEKELDSKTFLEAPYTQRH